MKTRIFFITLFLTLLPGKILAAVDPALGNAQTMLGSLDYSLGRGTNGDTAIFNVLGDIIERLPFYLTGLAFFAFLYSAAMYIFALGDATKQEAAKKNLTWTAIGMIAMVMVSLIIKFAGFISTHLTNITSIDQVTGL